MSNFLKALRGEPVDATPVWFMRQAGRYQKEYRELRKKYGILEIARNPELITYVTLLPEKNMDIDALILFSDIMLPLEAMGIRFEIQPGVGPVVENPVRKVEDVEKLRIIDPEGDLPFLFEAIRMIKSFSKLPLIGFSGAPFTLLSYMVEGGPSRNFLRVKRFIHNEKEAFTLVMDKLTESIVLYLREQIKAGVDAVQIFDSWVGALSPADYREFILPFMKKLIGQVQGVPVIHFGVNTGGILDLMAEAGGDVVGVDWRVRIDRAWEMFPDKGIQGNLDPALLLTEWGDVKRATIEILNAVQGKRGHIFNLGHGVLPETDPDMLKRLVDFVHEETAKR